MGFLLFIIVSIVTQTAALPIDLYNPDSANLPEFRGISIDTGPEICQENVNNDNTTNIKWYRYHNETHKCWHLDERGPCGKMMLFYPIGNSAYGDCDCNFYYRCARPLIYSTEKKRCYYTNDQGPCSTSDEWFILDDDLKPSCKPNPCISNQTLEPSTYDRYWFEQDGACYQTLSQGFCENPQEILYSKWDDYKPSCTVGRSCNSRSPKSSEAMPCIPGQKHDFVGNCRKPLRVNNWLSFSIFR